MSLLPTHFSKQRKRNERFRKVIIFFMTLIVLFVISLWAGLGYLSYEAITAVNDAGWEGTKEVLITGGKEIKEILDAINQQ